MVLEDIRKTCDIVRGNNMDNDYDRLYFSSNEPLDILFQNISVKDKDILSVLASSDHYFYSLYYGNRDVDIYDVNKLTKYYLYLRRWSILYNRNYYLPDYVLRSHKPIYELLQKVTCQDENEEEAYLYWCSYIQNFFPPDSVELFYIGSRRNELPNIDLLREKLYCSHPTFYHIDLFQEVTLPKKYDLVITSNIFEYGRSYTRKMVTCRDNMNRILKDKGEIVGTHLIHGDEDSYLDSERDIYEKYFEYEELPYYTQMFFHKKFPLGYRYIKK